MCAILSLTSTFAISSPDEFLLYWTVACDYGNIAKLQKTGAKYTVSDCILF